MNFAALSALIGIFLQTLTLCELAQITGHIVQQGAQIASYARTGNEPPVILVDSTSFLRTGRAMAGGSLSPVELDRILAPDARAASKAESIRCAPGLIGCTVENDAMLIEIQDYAWLGADQLTVSVAYHSTVRRNSGNTAVCELPMRLVFRKQTGAWRLQEAVPLRRC